MLAAGRLLPLHRGVYAVGHRPVGPRSREMAVVLLRARPSGCGDERLAGPSGTSSGGIASTPRTPLRTLLDLSGTLRLDALDAALAEALVRKLVTLEVLRPRATGDLRKLIDTAAPTRSKLERDLRRLLHEHGLPQPISNGFVCGYEVDLHWPDRLVAELDGYDSTTQESLRDRPPARPVLLAAGWRVARVTDRQLGALAKTAERFSALLLAPGLPRAEALR